MLLSVAAAAATMLMAAGCGTDDPDVDRGRQLFIQKCASCHAMAEAGSTSNVGPDLDEAFSASRAVGMDSDTVEGVVARQIENPRPSVEGQPAISMPADLVEGKDLVDVSAYVAEYAGVQGVEAPEFTLPEYFVNSCGGCHQLEDAGTAGVTGPNLDEVLAGQDPTADRGVDRQPRRRAQPRLRQPDAELVRRLADARPARAARQLPG